MFHIGDMANEPLFPVKKLIAISVEMGERISSYRFEQRIPSEAEAVRRLLEAGLRVAPGQSDDV